MVVMEAARQYLKYSNFNALIASANRFSFDHLQKEKN